MVLERLARLWRYQKPCSLARQYRDSSSQISTAEAQMMKPPAFAGKQKYRGTGLGRLDQLYGQRFFLSQEYNPYLLSRIDDNIRISLIPKNVFPLFDAFFQRSNNNSDVIDDHGALFLGTPANPNATPDTF